MSGNPTGSNVVPMPHAATPAPAQPPMPMPFPMWGGGGTLPWGPGCCPPGGMDALMKCYCDVQAATAFICSVMVQCIQTNPAVTAAIIAAIEASGSTLPLLGVTNGSNAQPGQVGEFQIFTTSGNIPTGSLNQPLSMGVLPAGDWDCWAWFEPSVFITGLLYALSSPSVNMPSVSNAMQGESTIPGGTGAFVVNSSTARISVAAPTLIVFDLLTDSSAAGTFQFQFEARRAR